MAQILAFYGSPRRQGNSATLLRQAVAGARQAGADVEEIVLRDLKLSPCLEIYGCRKTGRCAIQNDFQTIHDQIEASSGIMLASPIFFYTVSAHTKALMDRCQSFWVKKYWIDKVPFKVKRYRRKGLFIAVGATHGNKLFDGVLLTVNYFFDAIDTEPWGRLLCRGLDFQGDVAKHPEYLEQARAQGIAFAEAVLKPTGD